MDVFEGSRLETCEGLEIPNKAIGKISLIHSGTDGWIPEYVALVFDDSTFIQCPDNQGILDNAQSHDLLECGPV